MIQSVRFCIMEEGSLHPKRAGRQPVDGLPLEIHLIQDTYRNATEWPRFGTLIDCI